MKAQILLQNFKSFFRTNYPEYNKYNFPEYSVLVSILRTANINFYEAAKMLINYFEKK